MPTSNINSTPMWKLSKVVAITNATIEDIEKKINCKYRQVEYPPLGLLPGERRYYDPKHMDTINMNGQENKTLEYFIADRPDTPLIITVKELEPLKILIAPMAETEIEE